MSDINKLVEADLISNLNPGRKVIKTITKNVPKVDNIWKKTLDGGIRAGNNAISTARSIRG
jgi:hypothetical protein